MFGLQNHRSLAFVFRSSTRLLGCLFFVDHSKHSVTKALQIKQCLEFILSYILFVSAV